MLGSVELGWRNASPELEPLTSCKGLCSRLKGSAGRRGEKERKEGGKEGRREEKGSGGEPEEGVRKS